jgi:hypothetical protein
MTDGMMEAARSQRAFKEDLAWELELSSDHDTMAADAWDRGFTARKIKANYPSAKRLTRAKMYIVESEAGSVYLFVPLERPIGVGPAGALRYRIVAVVS